MLSSLKTLMRVPIRTLDRGLSLLYLHAGLERAGLVILLLHRVFEDERQVTAAGVDPLEGATVAHLRQAVNSLLESGYEFVSVSDVLNGVVSGSSRYAMITFDDGYANNLLVPPILEEYGVPAVFFISTQHVLEQKSFWWDVLYRERRRQRLSRDRIMQEAAALKLMTTEAIEEQLIQEFGKGALRPQHELERPMTAGELQSFARESHVTIGNHTANHAILTNYTDAEVRDQIRRAQRDLQAITGTLPEAISYPNGGYVRGTLEIARDAGLRLGITVDNRKNYSSFAPGSDKAMRLGRFIVSGSQSVQDQVILWRSDIALVNGLRRFRRQSY